jgi:hypothetical protein
MCSSFLLSSSPRRGTGLGLGLGLVQIGSRMDAIRG